MQLHDLSPKNPGRRATRIGRGGKRGTMSGRGQKGQKSRSGHKIRPAERDLIQRLPKLRGFTNKSRDIVKVVSVGALQKLPESTINLEVLKAHHLITKRYNGAVKVLSDGEVTRALTLVGLKVSEGAKAKIEKAGGKIS